MPDFRLAALVSFPVVVPFVAFPNLLQQLREKHKRKKNSLSFEGNAKH